jgi:hypothetical protein
MRCDVLTDGRRTEEKEEEKEKREMQRQKKEPHTEMWGKIG